MVFSPLWVDARMEAFFTNALVWGPSPSFWRLDAKRLVCFCAGDDQLLLSWWMFNRRKDSVFVVKSFSLFWFNFRSWDSNGCDTYYYVGSEIPPSLLEYFTLGSNLFKTIVIQEVEKITKETWNQGFCLACMPATCIPHAWTQHT